MAGDNGFFIDMENAVKTALETEANKQVAIQQAICNLRDKWKGQQVYVSHGVKYDQRDMIIRQDYSDMFKTLCNKHHLTFNQILKIIRTAPRKIEQDLEQSEMDI